MASKWKEIEQRFGRPMHQILIDLYEQYGGKANTQEMVAEKLGVTQSTVSLWIKLCRLEQRISLAHSEPPQPIPE